jgi:hypothetical protein
MTFHYFNSCLARCRCVKVRFVIRLETRSELLSTSEIQVIVRFLKKIQNYLSHPKLETAVKFEFVS